METNWQRFKFLLRKKRKGMKAAGGKALRVLGALALLATLFAPMSGPAPVAQAADLAWGGIRLPLEDAADTTAPFTDLASMPGNNNQRVAVASDGTVFVTRIDGASAAVWRSSDGGLTWRVANSTCATGNIDIKVSPKYGEDSTVAVLCSGVAAVPAVSLSRDGGATWPAVTNANITLPGGVTALSFDLAPNFSGTEGGMIVIGTTGVALDLVLGNRWTNAGDWAAALFRINGGAGPTGGAAADSVLAVGFSSKYATDSTVVVIVCNDTPDDVEEYRLSLGTTGVASGNLIGTAAGIDTPSATIAATCSAASTVRIGFPTDIESGATTYFALYNQDNNGVVAAPEDLYKRTGTTTLGTYSALTPASAGTVAVSGRGLAVSGTFADAHIYVLDDTGSPEIYRTTNGGTSWKTGVQLDKDGGAVGALGGNHDLALHPLYSTNNTLFATTVGVRGGVMKSTNGGSGWADTGLTNTDLNEGLIAMSAPSTSTHFLVTSDGTAAVTRAIWKTTNAGGSSAWQRVDRRDNVNVVKASPAFATDNTVYALVTAGSTEQALKSTDGGLSFKTASSDPIDKAVDSLAVVSATTAFVGSSNGYVLKTSDGGGTWSTSSPDMGNNVYEIAVSPDFATDNTIAVVAASVASVYQVWLSTDGGATFKQIGDGSTVWGSIATAVPRPTVIFSPDFATDNYLFLAPGDSSVSDALRRIDSKGTANWATMNATNWATGTPVSGMAAFKATGIGDGILFIGISSAAGGTVGRTYYPKTASSTNNVKRWLNSGADAASTFSQKDGTLIFESSGTYRYIALDTATDTMRTWTDTSAYLQQPTLTTPLNGGTVSSNTGQNAQPVVLSWSTKDRVWEWDFQIALDSNFDSPIVDTTTVAIDTACTILGVAVTTCGATAPLYLIPTGNLADGITYYWRVRVKEAGASEATGVRHDGPWSETRSFTVGSAGAPTAPSPSLPIDGSTLTGLGTNLSWNNPAGTTQVQIQVIPLNDDGPGINLIVNATSGYAVQAPVFGTGNYVMLPGATYIWRVRTSNATGSISESDPSWGPWSDIRTFKTPKPNAGTIQLLDPIGGKTVTDTKPVLTWKDSNAAMFYYEVQLSSDPNFGTGPQGAIAAVQHQLVHGAVASPPDSYTSPVDLVAGTYYWRVRQRVQATALGADELGIAWTASQSFKVQ